MQTETINHIRYPETRDRFLLNLVIKLWFEKRIEEIREEGKPDRIKRYESLNPAEMVVEPPLVFYPDKKIIRTCIVDRQAGTLLVDQDIPQITFDTFLERSDVSDEINPDGDFSSDVAAIVENGLTLENVMAVVKDNSKLSTDPIFYLTHLEGSTAPIILFDAKDSEPDFNKMISWIFRDYSFEDITMEQYEKSDAVFPSIDATDITKLFGGKVTLKDKILQEGTIAFNFIDLHLLNQLVLEKEGNELFNNLKVDEISKMKIPQFV